MKINVKHGKNLGLFTLCLLCFIIVQLCLAISTTESYDKYPIHNDNRYIDLLNPFYQGNFGYQYPIDVPAGINGMEPTLALVYNSELSKEKMLGVGWDLVGYNTIRRNDRSHTPWYDERDTYILTLDGKEYVFNAEGTFEEGNSLRVDKNGEGWIAYEGDGTKLVFAPKIKHKYITGMNYEWVMTKREDTNGNTITYNYDDSYLAEGVAYLESISYMDTNENQQTIHFVYTAYPVNANNLYPSTSAWPGFKIFYSQRLEQIIVGDATYQLQYKQSKGSLRWLLSEIRPPQPAEPIVFSYESDSMEDEDTLWELKDNTALPNVTEYVWDGDFNHIKDYDIFTKDFNNDGLVDLYIQKHQSYFNASNLIVEYDYLAQIYLNDGQGGWQSKPVYDFLSDRNLFSTKYNDIDEDIFEGITSEVYRRPTIKQELTPRFFDFNNDGALDISIRAHYYYDAYEYGMTLKIRWDETETLVFLNDGSGHFTYHTKYNGEPANLYQRDGVGSGSNPFGGSSPPILTDINGDCYPDFYYSGFHLNQGDNTYQKVSNVSDTKNYFSRYVDLNGDTLQEYAAYDRHTGLMSCDLDPRYNITLDISNHPQYCRNLSQSLNNAIYEVFADVNNDGLPDMVTINGVYINKTKSDRMVGVSGDETIKITYERLAVDGVYGEDVTKKGRKVYRWVVQSIQSDDSTSTFNYEGGWHDLLRQEFRGFSKITVSDSDGTTTYHYNPADRRMAGKVQSVTSPDGAVTYDYTLTGNDEAWQLTHLTTTSVSEGITSITENDYDEDGNLTKQTRDFSNGQISDVRTLLYTYSKNTGEHIINTLARSVELNSSKETIRENLYLYDNENSGTVIKGNLTRIDSKVWPTGTGSDDLTVGIGYDDHGVANSVADAQGNKTVTELVTVDDGYKKRITRNVLGHECYDLIENRSGLTVEHVDTNGSKTIYQYYPAPDNRLKRVIRPDGGFTDYVYQKDADGTTHITRTLEETGKTLMLWHEEHYDKKGNLVSTLDKEVRAADTDGSAPFTTIGRPVLTQKHYNSRGQVTEESPTYFEGETPKFIQYQYEDGYKHRILKVTYPDGVSARYVYDDANHRVTVFDAKNNRTVTEESYEYAVIEGRGSMACRVTTTTDAANQTSRAYYDLDGNLLQTIDANGKAKIYWYDSLGRVYKSKDPYKGQVTYVYGANGQLKTRTDAKGQVITYQYDVLNRLTAKVFPDNRQITWNYDQTSADSPVFTNGISRLTSYQDRSGMTLLGYDVMGNLTTKRHGSLSLTFGYNQQDRLRRITYPNNYKVNYTYDALGLSQVTAGDKVLATYTDRNAFGAAQSVEYANGVKTAFEFDANNGQLKGIKVGGGYLLNLSYTYDANGNVDSIQDLTPITSYHPVADHESYVYDTINRLIAVNGPYGSMSYAYDAVGNITAKEGVNFVYNDPDHPYAVTSGSNGYQATYDANGNMETRTDSYGNNYKLIYDEENQLVRIWKNDTYSEEYTYDATGYRVARNVGSVKTDYVYWGNTLLFESTQGKSINYVWAEGKLIAKVEPTGTTYFTHDHLGSSKLQTDDEGQVLSLDVTKPFGPRVCDALLKEDFANSNKVDLDKSTITYKVGEVRPSATGQAQTKLVANNSAVSMLSFDYAPAKALRFRLLSQDTDRKVTINFNVMGLARLKVTGEDGQTYLDKDYASTIGEVFTETVDLTTAPNQMYTAFLELAGTSSLQVRNTLFELHWGNVGANRGEFYSLPYELQEEVRSVRLTWTGTNVALLVSTDGTTWESVENGKTTLLTNPGTKLYVKGLLAANANTVLSGYQLEINPAKYSLFTGKTLEESTGLVYFGGRWYDTEIGRFITVDPAEDGENWYAYCDGNPTNYIDPDGMKKVVSNIPLGLLAHSLIEADFYHFGPPGDRYYELPHLTGIADIVLVNGGIAQVGEIKPDSYATNRVKNRQGKKQMLREITGVRILFGIKTVPIYLREKHYFNYAVKIPGTKWTLTVFTVEQDHGMIYYYFDDGENPGTPQPSLSMCWKLFYERMNRAYHQCSKELGLGENPLGGAVSPGLGQVPVFAR